MIENENTESELLCDYCEKKQAVYVVRLTVINMKNDEIKGETICICDACAKFVEIQSRFKHTNGMAHENI